MASSASSSSTTASLLLSHPILSPFFPGLAARDRAKRVDARRKLIGSIYGRAGDRSPAAFSGLLKELGAVGKQLIDTGTDVRDITTGFYVQDCLADIADDSQVERRLRFLFDILHYLEQDKPLPEAVIRVAGDCVGHLSRDASTSEMDFLREQYMATCVNWLRDKRSESRRLSALVVLHEIATNAPTLFYDEKRTFFEDVKATLTDPKQAIREAAADALCASLTVVYEREGGSDATFRELLREATTQLNAKTGGFAVVSSLTSNSGSSAMQHGALLVLQAVLLSCKRLKDVLKDEEYESMCEQVLGKLNSPGSMRAVRHTVLGLLPRLAMVDVTSFWYHFSSRITQHLLSCILKKGGEDQGPAYLSLGNLALVMGPSIFMAATTPTERASSKKSTTFNFHVVMNAINEGLTSSGAGGNNNNSAGGAFNEAMSCLSMIMRVSADVKENSTALTSMMPSLFRRGVTRPLVDTFETLSSRISPECCRSLQDLLLSEITSVLMRYCQLAQPNFTNHSSSSATASSSSSTTHHRDSFSSTLTSSSSSALSSLLQPTTTTAPPPPAPVPPSPTSFRPFTSTIDFTRTARQALLVRSPSAGPSLERSISLSTVVTSNVAALSSTWNMNKFFSTQAKEEDKPADADTVMLCLQTLSHFDFYSGNEDKAYEAMASLVRSVLIRLLHELDPYIRKTAGLTVATILNKVARSGRAHRVNLLVKQALNSLLTAGMADNSVDIRAAIFSALTPPLDPFLASPVNVDIIAIATNDESLEVRQHAIKILARITRQDTPRLLPLLRKVWVTLMDLVTLGSAKAARESLLLVQALLQVEPSLVKPYVHAFVRQIFSSLDRMGDGETLSAAISVVGELAAINPDDVRPFVDVLMPRLIDSLRGGGGTNVVTSSQQQLAGANREASMRALGQLCGATGVVVHSIYVTYPELYPVLLDILQRGDESSLHLRREAIRTFGILGALSPALLSSLEGGGSSGATANTTSAIKSSKQQPHYHRLSSGVGRGAAEAAAAGGAPVPTDAGGGGVNGGGGKEREETGGGGGGGPGGEEEGEEGLWSTQLLPLEELYPVMVLRALMKILKDPQASSQYPTALQTLMLVCKRVQGQHQGAKAVWRPPLARFVMLGLSETLQRTDLAPDFKVSLLEQFAVLIEVIGQQQQQSAPPMTSSQQLPSTFDIRDYIDLIMRVIRDNWESHMTLALSLVIKVWLTLGDMEFRLFLADVLPLMIATIVSEKSQPARPKTLEILNCLGKLRGCLARHFRQILPELLYLIRDSGNKATQKTALQLLIHATDAHPSSTPSSSCCLQDLSNLMVHTLLNLLSTPDVDLHRLAMNAILLMVSRLRLRFVPYILSVRKVVVAYCRTYPVFEAYLSTYDTLLLKILKGRPLPADFIAVENPWASAEQDKREKTMMMQQQQGGTVSSFQTMRSKTQHDAFVVKRGALEAAWDSSGYTTSSDWAEWVRRLSVELIRQSPSIVIRPCSALAQVHPSLAMGLFDVAFVSVWNELQQQQQHGGGGGGGIRPSWMAQSIPLVESLEQTLKSPSLPPEILNKLLNLVEFMELRDRPLPMDIRLLGAQSERAQAYAKCLKYREMEFRADPTPDCIEALISVYNQLGLREAAMGILRQSEDEEPQTSSSGTTAAAATTTTTTTTSSSSSLPSGAVVGGSGTTLGTGGSGGVLSSSTSSSTTTSSSSAAARRRGVGVTIRPSWLEKIHQWEKALSLYEAYADQHEDHEDSLGGRGPPPSRRRTSSATQKYGVTSSASGRHWKISSSGHITAAKTPSSSLAFPASLSSSAVPSSSSSSSYTAPGGSSGSTGATTTTSVTLDDLDLVAAKVGKLRCLDALGEYPLLLEESKGLKQRLHRAEYRAKPKWKEWVMQVLLLGTKAAFNLGQWQDMADFIATRSRVLPNEAFLVEDDPLVYEAMLKIVKNDFNGAQDCIERMRIRLAPVISSLLKESYTRVYRSMVTAQQLAELEEVIQYKRVCQSNGGPTSPPAQALLKHLRHKWDDRLRHAAQEIKVIRRMLATRSIVLRPSEDLSAWLHLASVCRRSGALTLCGNVLQAAGAVLPPFAATSEAAVVVAMDENLEALLGTGGDDDAAGGGGGDDDDDRRMPPPLRYSLYKFLWAAMHRPYALEKMVDLSRDLEARRGGFGCGVAGTTITTSTTSSSGGVGSGATPGGGGDEGEGGEEEEEEALLGKVYVRIGEWQMGLNEDNLERPVMEEVMGYLQKATELCPTSYKAWHSWARMNQHMVEKLQEANNNSNKKPLNISITSSKDKAAEAMLILSSGGDGGEEDDATTTTTAQEEAEAAKAKAKAALKQAQQAAMLREATSAKYAAQAISGFVRSIALGQNTNQRTAYILQDTLRLFTLWFRHGKQRIVSQEIEAGLDVVSADTWLGVVPQLIARIDSTSGPVSSLIRRLLIKVGRAHPQALIYPITLAANSTNEARKDAALTIMADMRTHSPLLVDEAEMVSREMINVAITRQELWHEGLEEASRLYFGEKNTSAAIYILEGLHKIGTTSVSGVGCSTSGGTTSGNAGGGAGSLDLSASRGGSISDDCGGGGGGGGSSREVDTIRTVAFYHCFEREVEEARAWLLAYKKSKNDADIAQAWEIYCSIFRQITKHLSGLKSLDLRHVAPSLLHHAKNLKLAVPGTYTPEAAGEVVRIASFGASVLVLASKQRPRRLTIMGSDGRPYMFLLKGHEDLRQDERVMQLFGLINVLLVNDQLTSRSNLRITRYAVMPLSSNSGIIGWVRNCDTLHQLIKDYRESKQIRLNVEHRLILSAAPDYDRLPLIQKCEVFMEALSQTRGMELSKMLWLKSASSEVWLERRTNYTRSLAVMSMAGYILGLGDRHPSNLMLDRLSGRIVHIDFGDCFEVAMTRTKFPEKVPFRLTRMLINAMEAGGIEGSFRITCENVMEVLRGNRDSLMAMLEAFVHDPLISWRLLAGDTNASFDDRTNTEGQQLQGGISSTMLAGPAEEAPPGERGPTSTRQPPQQQQDMAKTAPRTGGVDSFLLGASSMEDNSGLAAATVHQHQVNKRALVVIQRIQAKLIGRDFGGEEDGQPPLSVQAQVDKLIGQATSVENLSQLFMGWCPFW